jgi:DNA-binding transcriptional ArsR family regulator
MASANELVEWMKAAGEPSRLRLLALCAEREISVTELSLTLRQSGPRVSRHLKILCAAGLLERVRQGQWVHYQLSRNEAPAQFVRGLLAQLDRDDSVLVRDRQQARLAESVSAPAAVTGSRLGRSMRAFIDTTRATSRADSALIIGARHMELLEAATDIAAEGVAAMPSRRAAQAARSFIEDHRLPCRATVANSTEALKSSGAHGAVIVEHLNASADALVPLLAAARNVLPAGGRAWLFVEYEALEGARTDRVVEHPLARLRRLLAEAGLSCQQMSPIEADGEHVLAAVAVRSAASSTRPASVA